VHQRQTAAILEKVEQNVHSLDGQLHASIFVVEDARARERQALHAAEKDGQVVVFVPTTSDAAAL